MFTVWIVALPQWQRSRPGCRSQLLRERRHAISAPGLRVLSLEGRRSRDTLSSDVLRVEKGGRDPNTCEGHKVIDLEIPRRVCVCRRRDLRGGVCQQARVPALDERAETAPEVSGARDVRGIATRKGSDRDGVRPQALVQAGVRVFFYLTDTERTLNSPMEKAMLAIQAMSDELEREKARLRVHNAMVRKTHAHHVTGGQCFGYRNIDVTTAGADGRAHRQFAADATERQTPDTGSRGSGTHRRTD